MPNKLKILFAANVKIQRLNIQYFGSPFSIKQRVVDNDEACLPATLILSMQWSRTVDYEV